MNFVNSKANTKHSTVEKAKLWESYRNLPRFQHVPMAVIHPSPPRRKKNEVMPVPDLTISA